MTVVSVDQTARRSGSGPTLPGAQTVRPDSYDLLATSVVMLDTQGRVVRVNAAAESLFDISSRMMIGQSFHRMFSNGHVIEALLREAIGGEYEQKRIDLQLERPAREPLAL